MRILLNGILRLLILLFFVRFSSYSVEIITIAGTGSHGASDYGMGQFSLPGGVFSGNDGSLFVLDTYNNLIRRISPDGDVSPFAGNIQMHRGEPILDMFNFPRGGFEDGLLANALFNRPSGGVVTPDGVIYIADSGNHAIRRIVDGRVSTFVYESGLLYYPTAVAIDPQGNLVVADTGNNVIRRIDISGNVTTVAGVPGQYGYNNGPGHTALFNEPMGIAINSHGDIIVADSGNHLIRVIRNGEVTTLAGIYQLPEEEDDFEPWDMMPLGGFLDGSPNEAMFNLPVGLALWNDIIFVADSVNHAIRAILPDGWVTTISGSGYPGHVDGAVHEAAFHMPRGVYVLDYDLIIVDTGNNMIRRTLFEEVYDYDDV